MLSNVVVGEDSIWSGFVAETELCVVNSDVELVGLDVLKRWGVLCRKDEVEVEVEIVRAVDIAWGRFVPSGLFVIGVDKTWGVRLD